MKRLSEQTLYEILEIPQDASPPAIEAAVERARSLYGPGSLATYTLMSPDEAALLGARIDEAKRVLLDPESRGRYDASLANAEEMVRATANGTNGATPPFPQVPVIPAMQPPLEPPAARPPEAAVPAAQPDAEEAERAESSAAAIEPTPAAVESPPPPPPPAVAPARAPIRLDREIPATQPTPPHPASPPAERKERSGGTEAPDRGAPEIPIPDGAAWTGEALRRVREARGLTVHQIADRTKVTRHHVENIEGERFGALPAPVYLRGILLAIARELRLDGQKVARAYLDRAAAAQAGKR